MKRLKKILKWSGIILLVLLGSLTAIIYSRQSARYEAPYPVIKTTTDSAVLARGKYLVYGPGHCADCHSPAEKWQAIQDGEEVALTGGRKFAMPIGEIITPNITSDKETGIGNLSDGEIARALRYGVGHDGRALFEFMPFQNLSDEDLTAVISFLRTMPAVKNNIEVRDLNFLGKAVYAFMIKPVGPVGIPVKSIKPDSTAEYGKYLANHVGNCRGCHTNRDMMTGKFIGPDFAGGMHFKDDPELKGEFKTPNLTPDKETGRITDWTEKDFVDRFKKGRVYPTSPMPWGPFKNFSETDLKALYRYFKSLTPIKNKIDKIYEPEKK